ASASVRYSAEHLFGLWSEIMRLAQDPLIGFHMALIARPETFGVLAQVIRRCPTVLEAYQHMERYSAILAEMAQMHVARDASAFSMAVVMQAELPGGTTGFNIMLWILTNFARIAYHVTEREIRPRAVECTLPSPGSEELRLLRERLPFTFGARANRIVFEQSV